MTTAHPVHHGPTLRRPTLRRRLGALALVAATVATTATGCAPGGDDTSAATGSVTGGETRGEARGESADESTADGITAFDTAAQTATTATTASRRQAPAATARRVISTGNVALRADDVAEARFEVLEVVDRYGGEVAEEETATDDDGEPTRSRMVLRVPSDRFTDAVEGLKGAADLVSASTSNEDVTTKVLDVDIRVRVQRRSIRRIELLLDRAESIRDIVAIEAQLSRRQAALASLEKQQAYLADQTAMATLTVSIQRTPEREPRAEADAAGFLAGLSAGWDGLVTVAVGGATVAGALLPFAAAGLLLGLPTLLLVRRVRRLRRTGRPAAG